MNQKLTNFVRAGYAGLYIHSAEEQRVEAEVATVASSLGFRLHAWSVTQGIVEVAEKRRFADTQEPLAMLEAFDQLPEKSILLLRDFHLFLAEPNPMLLRRLKESLLVGKASNRVLILVGCVLKLPPELEKEFTVVEFRLPDRDQLRVVLDGIVQSYNSAPDRTPIETNGTADALLDAASGLTCLEAESVFALSLIEAGDLVPAIVAREKAATIRKSGLVEIMESRICLDDIGGLENLKRDLHESRALFSQAARAYFGRSQRKAYFVAGQAGTGKTLTALATASIFGLPLLRVRADNLFGSLVGESEQNWRRAFATARAIAPCVFMIDELDGLVAGAASSGRTDGGTTARVVKAMLQDMQENSDGILFFFTANDIEGVPDPLIDRCEIWSVDLPTQSEREAIWRIQIGKAGRQPGAFDLPLLAQRTDGFSGRQIEQVWMKALTLAFNDGRREPATGDVALAAGRFVPTSVTMGDAIKRRRERLLNRARPASAPEPAVPGKSARKLA